MKLYSYQPSPYGSRIRLALRRKNLPFDVAPAAEVDSAQYTFLAPSPMEVPTLVDDDGTSVSGSAAILDYLEDAYPQAALLPSAPSTQARVRMLVSTFDTYLQNAPRTLFDMADPLERNAAAIAEAFAMIDMGLAFLDARLDAAGSDDGWAVGGRASIADCALVPVLNAVALLSAIHGRADTIARHAHLGAYWDAAKREPLHAELLAEQLAGLPGPLQRLAEEAGMVPIA